MDRKRNNLFDLLRVLFAASVVVSHASGIIYHGEIVSANVAVDGFFMLSGFFMAKHLHKRKEESPDRIFLDYQLGRIKRLFPMYILSCFLGLLSELSVHHRFDICKWPALYFLGDINGIPGYPATWYVAALFWAGIAVSAPLVYRRKLSVTIVFPVAFFVLFSAMYQHHNLWLFSEPLVAGFLSAGVMKAVCALCVGAEIFYASLLLKSKEAKLRPCAKKIASAMCEIIFIAGFTSSFWIWFSPKNFLVYLYVPLVLLVFSLDGQVLFRILDSRIFSALGKTTYAVYLTHLYFLKFLAKIEAWQKIPMIPAYVLILSASFAIGWGFSKIEKNAMKILKNAAFKQA